MCGFLGELSSPLIEKNTFKKLLDLSIKRGPDQQGFWSNDKCQLGFNRLSIIDLSENANQPLISPSENFAMVFNGQVYNYKEIQIKFKINDSELRSKSDSEILVHLIDKVEILDFAKELNGMFAIAIYDIKKEKVHLIRDFAGIKPIFYGQFEKGIVFASQFDQIFQHPSFLKKELRADVVKEYFGLGYMPAPNTVFENIFQVEPGTIVTWSLKEGEIISMQTYFKWEINKKLKETSPEAITEFKNLFSSVVKSQLNADVPVATFLSGGIDSPLVSKFSKDFKRDIKSFTFGINDEDFNETIVASKIANQLDLSHHIETNSDKNILRIANEHFKSLSEPLGDYSSIPTYLITKKAKIHATVMLSGDGGDELFWGYPRYLRSLDHLHWFKIPFFIRKIVAPIYRKVYKKTSSAIDIFKNFDSWTLSKKIVMPDLDKLFPKSNFTQELLNKYSYDSTLNKENALLYLKKNEFYGNLQMILRKVDLMSMANSLEVRVPFLDKKIINFSNSIIPEYGIKHKKPKIILRKLLNQFIDKKTTELPKKGFSIPLEKWLKNELKDDVLETLVNQSIYGEKFFDKSYFNKIINDFYLEKNNHWQLIWYFYVWQKWTINYQLDKESV